MDKFEMALPSTGYMIRLGIYMLYDHTRNRILCRVCIDKTPVETELAALNDVKQGIRAISIW